MNRIEIQHGNQLLGGLSPDAWQRLAPHLERVSLPRDCMLSAAGTEVAFAYFPISCAVSLLAIERSGATPEVATVGCEGMVGISAILGMATEHAGAMVRTAGEAYRMRASCLRTEFERARSLRDALLRYTYTLIVQVAQVAVCNQRHTVAQRLTRWLLCGTDWLPGSTEIAMTHERIARLLDVRREGVTAAAGQLQRAGLVRYRRGAIAVVDRVGLESRACDCYRIIRMALKSLQPLERNAAADAQWPESARAVSTTRRLEQQCCSGATSAHR
jgi:CRP-like cAMP-binding protein